MRCRGYLRSLQQYLKTPKGAYDARDYLRALLLILLSMGAAVCLLQLILGE